MFRATAYGMWSLLVPVGYNRDPAAHFGYKKVAMILEHTYTVNEEELVTEKDITRSRGKECIWQIYLNSTQKHHIITTSISFCISMFKRSPWQIFFDHAYSNQHLRFGSKSDFYVDHHPLQSDSLLPTNDINAGGKFDTYVYQICKLF